VLRLAVIGTVSTLTVDDLDRPLNLGRKQRLASQAQWIALTIRDNGCVTPGCEAPPILRMALVCSFHHHLIHDAGWKLTARPDATWHLTRPDGTDVEEPRYSTHPAGSRARAQPERP